MHNKGRKWKWICGSPEQVDYCGIIAQCRFWDKGH